MSSGLLNERRSRYRNGAIPITPIRTRTTYETIRPRTRVLILAPRQGQSLPCQGQSLPCPGLSLSRGARRSRELLVAEAHEPEQDRHADRGRDHHHVRDRRRVAVVVELEPALERLERERRR